MHCIKILYIHQRLVFGAVSWDTFGQPITVENYLYVLTQFVAPLEGMNQDCWFQQDGMPAHMAKTTAFSHHFHDRIVRHRLWLL